VPVQVNFPTPTDTDLIDILERSIDNKDFNVDTIKLKKTCIDFVVKAYPDDLLKLQYITEKKLLPILNHFSNSKSQDQNLSFKVFKSSLNADDRLVSMNQSVPSSDNVEECLTVFAMPRTTKLLLIAAFIASFNAPTSDARYFLKKTDKKRVTCRKTNGFKTQFYRGPKPFFLERLLMITAKLRSDFVTTGKDMHFSNDILSQVTSLCELKMLQRCSNERLLDGVKYKCLCPMQSIQKLAKSINIDLVQYLHNYH